MAKVTKAEIYKHIARRMLGDPMSLLPPFPHALHTVETSPGVRLYLREYEPGVVEYVHEYYVANAILEWAHTSVAATHEGYNLEFKNAVEAARVWRAMATPVTKIKNVAFPGEEGLTFRRLPWDIAEGSYPTFDEMFSRISNSYALSAFIGSLLVEESDMQQYVWLYGQGQNGKGALSRFLHKVFGNAFSSQIPPLRGDRFWTSMIMGKRLVVFPDCNNQEFVTSGLFKSLTGGDPVRVEQKQQPATTVIMGAKYLFLSNERPALSSEKADQRRVIYCEMEAIQGDPDPDYEARLWSEGGAFLAACLKSYHNLCPRHQGIAVSKDSILADWVSTVEEEFETVWEANFCISPNKSAYVTPAAFQDRLNEIWPKDRKSQQQFRSWAERVHGVRKKTHPHLPNTPKVYFAVQIIFAGHLIRTAQIVQAELQKRWPDVRTYRDG